MKYLIILLTILLMVWSLNAYVGFFINTSTDALMEHIKNAKTAALAHDLAAAAKEISAMRELWEEGEGRWEAFSDHREIERVDTAINHLEGMVDAEITQDMPVELQELEYLLRQMNDKHKLRLENIL